MEKLTPRVYFASDMHLGAPNREASLLREKKFVRWLDQIKSDATAVYIVGDLFDFWFEYKTVVPRGYVRLFGKLAELRDQDIPIYFLTGNHDLWMFGYFEEELNIPVYHQSIIREIGGKRFFIAHGDGLGPGDTKYKWLKKYFFTNRLCQWLLGAIHPNWAIGVANYFSHKSRLSNEEYEEKSAYDEETERLLQYALRKRAQQQVDYFIFGHRHLPMKKQLSPDSYYVNLGDWIKHFSYALFNGEDIELHFFEREQPPMCPSHANTDDRNEFSTPAS